MFIDLYSRMVVGWAVSKSLSHEGVLRALVLSDMATKATSGADDPRGFGECSIAVKHFGM